eukprot:scaffold98341_cov43-Phaeocystis_antarctica.AAC.2
MRGQWIGSWAAGRLWCAGESSWPSCTEEAGRTQVPGARSTASAPSPYCLPPSTPRTTFYCAVEMFITDALRTGVGG